MSAKDLLLQNPHFTITFTVTKRFRVINCSENADNTFTILATEDKEDDTMADDAPATICQYDPYSLDEFDEEMMSSV